jgi:FKBP-type peptidyl-prolyl cis-trans isomerase
MPPKKKAASGGTSTVLDKIILAIRSQPPSAKGASRTAITKYLAHELDYNNTTAIKKALQAGVKSKRLIQTGQSFRVAGDVVPELPPEEKVDIVDVKDGRGHEAATVGQTVVVAYEGHLDSLDGPVFDKSSNFDFCLGAGDVIKGWDTGIAGMKVGGIRELVVPSKLGYGKRGSPPDIPPNATLYFRVTLKAIHS